MQRFQYHHFEGFSEMDKMGMVSEARKRKRKNEKLGSDLVVQRSRYDHFEAFIEIYKMGIVSAA